MNNIRPKAICVLGMHRSGTSVLSRAINLMGVYIGKDADIMIPLPDNPEGFWERDDVVYLHDRLLKAMKRNWNTALPLRGTWQKSAEVAPFRKELVDLVIKNFKDKRLWAWKDPRSSLLLPLWKDVLEELEIDLRPVLIVRNPLDVAISLKRRDGFSYDKSFGIWFSYNISALMAVQDMPISFISYDRLVEDSLGELKRCALELEIPRAKDDVTMASDLEKFIRPDLRHNVSIFDDLKKNNAPGPVSKLYDLLSRLIKTSPELSSSDVSEVEKLVKEFSQYSSFYEYDLNLKFDLNEKVSVLEGKVKEKDQLTKEKDELNNRKDQLIEEKDRVILEKDELNKRKDQLIEEKDRVILEKERALMIKEEQLKRTYNSLSWRLTSPLRRASGFLR